MNWMDTEISLYITHYDNTGRPATIREILMSEFQIDIICELRKLDENHKNYEADKKELKDRLKAYTPAGLLASKQKDNVIEIKRSGIMQLDFDGNDIADYDILELKQCVFSLPFIGFCGLSCSGKGFYALALIAEPEKLKDYAFHCFDVLQQYGIKADRSKGRNVQDLRYLSYDSNMLIRENPEPLYVKRFKPQPAPQRKIVETTTDLNLHGKSKVMLLWGLKEIRNATIGHRFPTVQKVAHTLGGLNIECTLDYIINTINTSEQYKGVESKYIDCAKACYNDGLAKKIEIVW